MIYDVAIIGAGIAGASLAAELGPQTRVVIVEGEAFPGYHSTGRSAAFWDETYGGPGVQPLTTASGPLLATPEPALSDTGFLSPRGALFVGRESEVAQFASLKADFAGTDVRLDALDHAAAIGRAPGLRDSWTQALWQPACADIDVARLHAAYLSMARRNGSRLETNSPVSSLSRRDGVWEIVSKGQTYRAAILVNAAGAWADEVAAMARVPPIGIQPYRRTMAQVRISPSAPANLPLVIHIGGDFYLKPDAGGRIWLSPHDETPVAASDVAAEEYDVALAIDRLQSLMDWTIEAIERKWAGLRSFAPDRLPVYGFDPAEPDFFWCAGQGGFGIQTAPAAAKLAAAMLLKASPDDAVKDIDPTPFAAARFRTE